MNKKRIIIIVIVLLILGFFGYKSINYYRYTFERPDGVENVVRGLKNQKSVNVERKKLQEKEYFKASNVIKMKNIFDGYTLEGTNNDITLSYKKKTEDKEYTIIVDNGNNREQIIDLFLDDEEVVFADLGGFKGSVKDADRKGFLEKNNIKNDIDFYKFAADNYFIESNFFTNAKTLKQNFAFNLFAASVLPEIEGWTIIEGELTGYYINVGTKDDITVYEIDIIENNKRYGIITNDPRFNDEAFMIDAISTIVIE